MANGDDERGWERGQAVLAMCACTVPSMGQAVEAAAEAAVAQQQRRQVQQLERVRRQGSAEERMSGYPR